MSNPTRFTLGVLADGGATSMQPRPTMTTPPPGYDIAILILNDALIRLARDPTVRLRKPYHNASRAWSRFLG